MADLDDFNLDDINLDDVMMEIAPNQPPEVELEYFDSEHLEALKNKWIQTQDANIEYGFNNDTEFYFLRALPDNFHYDKNSFVTATFENKLSQMSAVWIEHYSLVDNQPKCLASCYLKSSPPGWHDFALPVNSQQFDNEFY